jgi:lipopolysaccharide/colanic/teichoic acid biosynthesis glycosyltransferase
VIRFFDILFASIGLVLLSPLFLVFALCIRIESRGSVFYKQIRVGKDGVDFKLYKFRTMHSGSDEKGLITVGTRDRRITVTGYRLRKYKLDELPQLINVLKGDMSLVGPRPEVRKYVDLYNIDQMKVLKVPPGLTDYASIEYIHENRLLGNAANPEKTYIEQVMPDKIQYNMKYINNRSLSEYFRIIFITVWKIIV